MSLVDSDWLTHPRTRGLLAAAGCTATALLLIVLNALAANLVVSVLLVGLGIPVILLLVKGLEWTIHLMMVAGMFFAPLNDVRAGGFITAADVLFVLGFLMLTPSLLRRRILVSQLYLAGWIVMFITGLLASIAATNTGISFNHMARFAVAGLILPLAFMIWRPSSALLVRLAAAYVAGSTVSVVYAATLGGGIRPIGLTTHPNFFGLTSVLAATLVPYVVQHTRRSHRWWLWLAGLICVYGVWISGSRAAFVALGAVVLVYTLVEGSLLMAGALATSGALVLLFLDQLGKLDGTNALSRILGKGSAEGSDIQREQAFDQAVRSFQAHPILGNGFEHAMEAHSIYLQIVVSIGVIGLVGYALVFAAMIHPLADKRRPSYRLAYPALTYAIVGVFTNSLWDRFVWAVLALSLIGVVLDNQQRARSERQARAQQPIEPAVPPSPAGTTA